MSELDKQMWNENKVSGFTQAHEKCAMKIEEKVNDSHVNGR